MRHVPFLALTALFAAFVPTACSSSSSEQSPDGSQDAGMDSSIDSSFDATDGASDVQDGAVHSDANVDAALDAGQGTCTFQQPFPYASGSTWPGLRGARENNNREYCRGPERVKHEWNALDQIPVFQPVSLSGDGATLYAIGARTEGCVLFAVDTSSGAQRWCSKDFTIGASGGTVEVDEDGNLYLTDGFTAEATMTSLTPDGKQRWRTSLKGLGGSGPAKFRSPAGLHFTPGGYAATITVDGVVVLLNRADGSIAKSFDIPKETGFVPAASSDGSMDVSKLPKYIKDRLNKYVGPLTDQDLEYIFGASTGDSPAFSDNTIGITAKSQALVTGGGPDPDHGALTCLDLDETGAKPKITWRWSAVFEKGSATSPAITRDGTKVVIGDGAGHLVYIDIDKCNANKDADTDPKRCAPLWTYDLIGKPLLGSAGMDENGVAYVWNTAKEATDTDLFAITDDGGKPKVLWKRAFKSPGGTNMQWTSSLTTTDNVLVGTLTDIQKAIDVGAGSPLVTKMSNEVVGVSRADGHIVWRASVHDDSFNSLVVGPDLSVYVPLLGMLSLTTPSPSFGYQGGVVKYRSVEP